MGALAEQEVWPAKFTNLPPVRRQGFSWFVRIPSESPQKDKEEKENGQPDISP